MGRKPPKSVTKPQASISMPTKGQPASRTKIPPKKAATPFQMTRYEYFRLIYFSDEVNLVSNFISVSDVDFWVDHAAGLRRNLMRVREMKRESKTRSKDERSRIEYYNDETKRQETEVRGRLLKFLCEEMDVVRSQKLTNFRSGWRKKFFSLSGPIQQPSPFYIKITNKLNFSSD